jgi:hypothetical protein
MWRRIDAQQRCSAQAEQRPFKLWSVRNHPMYQ